jgi:hypothetical protein
VSGKLEAVGSGGFDRAHTDPDSEAVRSRDGTCRGWASPLHGTWTSSVAPGAGFALLDPATYAVVGAGVLGSGRWTDAAAPRGKWLCEFSFSATLSSDVPTPQIQVADLPSRPTAAGAAGATTLVAFLAMPTPRVVIA